MQHVDHDVDAYHPVAVSPLHYQVTLHCCYSIGWALHYVFPLMQCKSPHLQILHLDIEQRNSGQDGKSLT